MALSGVGTPRTTMLSGAPGLHPLWALGYSKGRAWKEGPQWPSRQLVWSTPQFETDQEAKAWGHMAGQWQGCKSCSTHWARDSGQVKEPRIRFLIYKIEITLTPTVCTGNEIKTISKEQNTHLACTTRSTNASFYPLKHHLGRCTSGPPLQTTVSQRQNGKWPNVHQEETKLHKLSEA